VQVINAAPSPTGKPDVTIGFRLFRRAGETEEAAGSLSPLQYNESTVPVDFNLALGHPILAARAAPLRSLARGAYRLEITATDRIAGTSTRSNTTFRVGHAGHAAGLRARVCPGLPADAAHRARGDGHRARRARAARKHTGVGAPRANGPPEPFRRATPQCRAHAAGARRGALLQAMGFYALGDNPTAVGLQLQLALERGAPEPATRFWMGACLAIERKDEDAVAAWRAALEGGWPAALVHAPLAEALVRLGRMKDAGQIAKQSLAAGSTEPALVRLSAAADIAAGQLAPAVATLDAHLGRSPDDLDAQWLMLHALFAGVVKADEPGAAPDGRVRFAELTDRYIGSGGRHRALAAEWRAFVTSSSSAQP
jgi:hypothetical protein